MIEGSLNDQLCVRVIGPMAHRQRGGLWQSATQTREYGCVFIYFYIYISLMSLSLLPGADLKDMWGGERAISQEETSSLSP